jgi:hypothetical protein
MDPMTIAFAVLGMVFLVALLMWARARQQIRQSGILDGRVVRTPTGATMSNVPWCLRVAA